MRLPAILLALLAGACAAGKPAVPPPPEDTLLRQNATAGRLALSLDRPQEAVTQYRAALARALARDDAAAIGDYGYDLAVAQLAADDPRGALVSARSTAADLAHRRVAPFPALILVEATALYRSGAAREADRLAASVERNGDQPVAARAAFLRGLIADKAGDDAGLRAAAARLGRPTSPEQQADADELVARVDRRAGRNETAAAAAEAAADLRRDNLDYRDMARALALAASARERAGAAGAAANLYLRAGQSAAEQGDAATARPWLQAALRLDHDPALQRQARRIMEGLPKR